MDTLSKVQVMRWMDTNTVKCLQVMRWIDKNRHQSPPPPPPHPTPACRNESLAHSYHTNRTNFLPRDMNKTAANASAYTACKGIYESKTDYNSRSTKLGENDGKYCLMTNVNIIFFYHVPVFCKKSRSVSSTWKHSEEAVTYNSPDVK